MESNSVDLSKIGTVEDKQTSKKIEKKKRFLTTRTNSSLDFASDFIRRWYLTIPAPRKLAIYSIIITIASIIGDVGRPNHFYFSRKESILNQYFVKLGWGWTLLGVAALTLLSNMVFNKGKFAPSFSYQSLLRMAVMTIYWYCCTEFFEWLENLTGSCSDRTAPRKPSCLKAGHDWLGFDFSGHTFLLVHSLLYINEESGIIYDVAKQIDNFEITSREHPENLSVALQQRSYLRIITILLVYLTFLWEFMLFITAFYYHSTVQKLGALILGTGAWFFVYKLFRTSMFRWPVSC